MNSLHFPCPGLSPRMFSNELGFAIIPFIGKWLKQGRPSLARERRMRTDDIIEIMTRRYERFMERLREQDPNGAAEEFSKFLHSLRRNNLKIPTRTLAAFAEAWLDLFWQCRRFDLMLKVAEDAQEVFGEDLEWTFARGEALF